MPTTAIKRTAFSLLELLAVVALLGILAALLVPRVTATADTANSRADATNRAYINLAVEQYRLAEGDWPADDLSDIAADPVYFPDGLPINPVTNAAYTLDSTTHRVAE